MSPDFLEPMRPATWHKASSAVADMDRAWRATWATAHACAPTLPCSLRFPTLQALNELAPGAQPREAYGGPRTKAALIKPGTFSSKQELMELIQPFEFTHLGNESAEKAQLKGMGWQPYEAAKFYSPSDHLWYWYVYGE